ncbi:Cytosolic [Perkinsus olseni]|uniref:Cytosolic n=1 Tax=Perkinsus olseni TaxID=32597 RepID=A0A7J6T6Q2_PEROL|nr:Cytosolic [Perkinsus olseni]
MDGVLCNLDAALGREMHDRYGVLPIAPSQRIRYSITTEYSSLDESYRDYVLEILYSRGFFESIPPIPGAIQGVKLLASVPNVKARTSSSALLPCHLRHQVIVTSSYLLDSRHCASEKKKWPEPPTGTTPRFIVDLVLDKTLLFGDVLIDDNPRITGSCSPPMFGHQVLFTQPYNMRAKARLRLDGWFTTLEEAEVFVEVTSGFTRILGSESDNNFNGISSVIAA